MSENPITIESEPKNNLGESLVKIGNKIKEISDHEVPNKQVIAGLAALGAAEVCLMVGADISGNKLFDLGSTLSSIGDAAFNANNYSLAASYYYASSEHFGKAADAYTISQLQSLVLAGEVATIAGIEVPRFAKYKESLVDMDGKTKVSTHVGPILAEIFTKVGNHFDRK